MEPKLITRESFRIMGLTARIKLEAADYHDLWQNQYMKHEAQVEAAAIEEGHYSAYFATDDPGMADFVGGMAVGEVESVPEGCVVREVLGGEFALVECALDAIGLTWGAIYEEWLPGSPYKEDETRACFEYFPPGIEQGERNVLIHVPLEAKHA